MNMIKRHYMRLLTKQKKILLNQLVFLLNLALIEKAKLEKASRFSRLVNFPISHNQRLTITPSPGVPISPLPSAKRDTTVDISVSRNNNFNKTSNFILSYEREKV